ncbi:hypothetical protein DPMN_089619 [Dreissena polymorpha]|uniref:YqaJ viral recombinase domain-containing protein n=1 Tax=Dreissena polymorpha TaxID=45954 RepID=A0A9D4KX51_DREPO|nr:hypothetical protein DPMN_089619 [Dreissena polymorpha]
MYAKQKLVERCGEVDCKNSKFVMAISNTMAYIHDIDKYIADVRDVLDELILCISYLNKNASHLIRGDNGNLNTLASFVQIPASNADMSDTRNVKQRTEERHPKRKTAKVTGSTIYTAIGLDSVQKQSDYSDELLCGFPKHISDKVNAFMAYGTEKEPSAMLTLAGKVLPVLFPDTLCCEEGFVELGKDKNNTPYMVVSPDGSVRCNTTVESTIIAIELKCPVFEIHKTLPTQYFLQCQAEIAALNVDSLVYLCWRPNFSSVFIVTKQSELFSRAYKLSENLYNNGAPKRARVLSPELKSQKKGYRTCV